MINKIAIKNYKIISNADLNIKPLTIIAGPNSVGKSSLIQAITLCSLGDNSKLDLLEDYSNYEAVVNQDYYGFPVEINIKDIFSSDIIITQNEITEHHSKNIFRIFDKNFFLLMADRNSLKSIEKMPYNLSSKFGANGEYTLGTFYNNKDKEIYKKLLVDLPSNTLKAQVAWWLSKLTDSECRVNVSKINPQEVQVSFKINDYDNLTPNNVGIGNSFLVKLITLCLLAKPDDILCIENPEIHLHPKAQALLGKFFAHIVNACIQLIIETHCEHLIDVIRYEIFKKRLPSENAIILYKSSLVSNFDEISINEDGNYIDSENNIQSFPDGFFDSTLKELTEMSNC